MLLQSELQQANSIIKGLALYKISADAVFLLPWLHKHTTEHELQQCLGKSYSH